MGLDVDGVRLEPIPPRGVVDSVAEACDAIGRCIRVVAPWAWKMPEHAYAGCTYEIQSLVDDCKVYASLLNGKDERVLPEAQRWTSAILKRYTTLRENALPFLEEYNIEAPNIDDYYCDEAPRERRRIGNKKPVVVI